MSPRSGGITDYRGPGPGLKAPGGAGAEGRWNQHTGVPPATTAARTATRYWWARSHWDGQANIFRPGPTPKNRGHQRRSPNWGGGAKGPAGGITTQKRGRGCTQPRRPPPRRDVIELQRASSSRVILPGLRGKADPWRTELDQRLGRAANPRPGRPPGHGRSTRPAGNRGWLADGGAGTETASRGRGSLCALAAGALKKAPDRDFFGRENCAAGAGRRLLPPLGSGAGAGVLLVLVPSADRDCGLPRLSVGQPRRSSASRSDQFSTGGGGNPEGTPTGHADPGCPPPRGARS